MQNKHASLKLPFSELLQHISTTIMDFIKEVNFYHLV